MKKIGSIGVADASEAIWKCDTKVQRRNCKCKRGTEYPSFVFYVEPLLHQPVWREMEHEKLATGCQRVRVSARRWNGFNP